jgi:hypothetical protein
LGEGGLSGCMSVRIAPQLVRPTPNTTGVVITPPVTEAIGQRVIPGVGRQDKEGLLAHVQIGPLLLGYVAKLATDRGTVRDVSTHECGVDTHIDAPIIG